MTIKRFTLDRHINLIERIFHDIVGVELIDTPHDDVDVGLIGFGEEQEFGPRQGLEALHPEVLALE